MSLVEAVCRSVEQMFGVRTTIAMPEAWPASAFDERRRQLSSTRVLAWLASRLPADGSKALALTDVDLYIPILTFVFGEAQLGGRAAVVSTARLRDPTNLAPTRLRERLVKEAAHEIGHVFGLLHCDRAACVMARSATLLDVENKGRTLCADCRVWLADRRREEVPDV